MASLQSVQAFYLKYRPQKLDEVIGQEAVKKLLWSAFENNKLSHAYLFVGPRGTGKTSTARILAKMVNCEKVGSDEFRVHGKDKNTTNHEHITRNLPCNQCSTCLSITDGSNLDLIEIDAASNRGIEDIRSLREKIKLAPTSSEKKVYIIDEVHMLTTEAFNALLKTLEEPPSHALFILATTDESRIPQTILSRVQRLDFKLATQSELHKALSKIVEKENIDIDDESLKLLIKKADGSFRDGVKLLDQISSIQGKITLSLVEEALKLGKLDEVLDLLENLSNSKIKESLKVTSKAINDGLDAKDLMQSLMDGLRNIMLIKNGLGEDLVLSQFREEVYEKLVKLSESFSNQELIRCLEILQANLEKLKFASIPQLPLELAVVEICEENSKFNLSTSLGARIQNLKLESQVKSETPEDSVSKIKSIDQKISSKLVDEKVSQNFENEVVVDNSIVQPQSADQDMSELSKIKEKWAYVLETIRSTNFSLEALLRSVAISQCTKDAVVLEVPYSFHQRILESPKNRDLLESILSDILGRSIKIVTALGTRPKRLEDVANIEVAQDDEIIRAAAEIFNSDSIN